MLRLVELLLTRSQIWVALVAFAISVFLLWLRKLVNINKTFERLGIPGPKPRLILGNAMDFAGKSSFDVFKEWVDQYGPVFGFMEGMTPSIVVTCPELSREVLIKQFSKFADRPTVCPFKHDFSDLSLVNITGKLWKRQRHAVAGAMTYNSLKEMFIKMCNVTEDFIRRLDLAAKENPEGFEVAELTVRFYVDLFSHSALGFPSNALGDPCDIMNRFQRAARNSASPENAFTGLARLFPILAPLLTPFDTEHKESSNELTKRLSLYVAELRGKSGDANPKLYSNFIQRLISRNNPNDIISSSLHKRNGINGTATYCWNNAEEEKERKVAVGKTSLRDEEIVGEITGLVGGGLGPLSATCLFCLYCLAVYPKQRRVVLREIDSVVEDKNSISFSELHHLPHLDNFIYESLRLYPVAPGVSRECVEPCEINGVTFEPGMVVRIMQGIMCHDEKYFTSPSTFDPDRFLVQEISRQNSNISDSGQNTAQMTSTASSPSCRRHSCDDVRGSTSCNWNAFLPFGLGPRMCVGHRLARVAIKLALVRILQEFDLSQSSATQVPIETALRPFLVPRDGLHIKLTKRIRTDIHVHP